MKKILLIVITAVFMFTMSACSAKEIVSVCSLEADLSELYGIEGSLVSETKITHVDDRVIYIESSEHLKISDSDIFNETVTSYQKLVEVISNIEHYESNLTIGDNSIDYKTTIDYLKIDINDILAVEKGFKAFLNEKNHLLFSKLEVGFEIKGIKCDK